MRIAVAGMGYVGLSMACLLARTHEVVAVDVVEQKVDLVNQGVSPLAEPEIEHAIASDATQLSATCDARSAYQNADLVIIATPTDYDPERGYFDTSSIEQVLALLAELDYAGLAVIRSTIPVGYTEAMAKNNPKLSILFSPEFLREGHSLEDNLHPSRIIVGVPAVDADRADALQRQAEGFARLLADAAEDADTPMRIMGASEAESVKLFSNTYLALRVAFFNELDTYANARGLDARSIIDGVCLDPRIGDEYNNPSFGYGGYCLPKDTKQLLANYRNVPQNLIGAIVEANRTRKSHVTSDVLAFARSLAGDEEPVVGIYRLSMKKNATNIRSSSVLGVVRRLAAQDIPVLIYAPSYDEPSILGCEITHDLDELKRRATVIVANRWDAELADVAERVYTRDLFGRD